MSSRPSLDRGGAGPLRVFLDDRFILAAILANALVLTLLLFDRWEHTRSLELLDQGFTTYFVVEAAAKIRRDGWKKYIASGWNRFDFGIVVLSLPSFAVYVLEIPDLSFLLLLRVLRVMKFFRFIRFVPEIGQLIDGTRRAVRASAFVVLAFFLFNFVIALLSCHLFRAAAPDFFGDPLISFYSIFKVFTIEGWYEIPDAISEGASPAFGFFVRLYFMVVVVVGGLFGLSLVNAIFVDEMLRNENDLIEQRLSDVSDKLDRLLAMTSARSGSAEAPPSPSPSPGDPT